MKTLKQLIFLFASLMLISPQAGAQQNALNLDDPIGGVAKMTEQYFSIDVNREPGEQLILSNYFVCKFDKNGNRVEDLEFDAKDNLLKKYSYENVKGKREKLVITDSKGKLIKTIVYTYNEKGLLENDQSYDATGKPEKTFVYQYDDKGVLRENYSYLKAGEFEMKYTYTYDFKGNIDRNFRFTQGGFLLEERQYKYDQKNQPVSEVIKNETGDILESITCQYVYDKKRNWIEKTTLMDNHPVKLVKRKITYN